MVTASRHGPSAGDGASNAIPAPSLPASHLESSVLFVSSVPSRISFNHDGQAGTPTRFTAAALMVTRPSSPAFFPHRLARPAGPERKRLVPPVGTAATSLPTDVTGMNARGLKARRERGKQADGRPGRAPHHLEN